MAKDIHSKEFDDGTKIKLEILRKYIQEWLPVFIVKKQPDWGMIYMYDFFAGAGRDLNGNPGSPIIILEEIRPYCRAIKEKRLKVKLFFNEVSQRKSKKLQDACVEHLQTCSSKDNAGDYCPGRDTNGCPFHITYCQDEFKECFSYYLPQMSAGSRYPRFMFLDQYGIKEVTQGIFRALISLKRTDFLFFISSSYARRFIELPEFKNYLRLTKQDFDENKPHHCHQVIFKYYRSLVPDDVKFYLAPFSIKKDRNIYGLIFGSNSTLGIEKFLRICWRINPTTGNANYDIDNENINLNQPSLFQEYNISTKLKLFERDLREKITRKEFRSNREIYSFTFERGCLPAHANKVVKELKKSGLIPKEFKTVSQNIHKLEISYL
jgi:three-Cys-motif partner protein